MGSSEIPTTIIMVKEHSNTIIPNDLLLHPQDKALPNPYQSELMQQTVINTDIPLSNVQRMRNSGALNFKWMSL